MQDGPRPAALARVPPNNLRAEESVLGAMLLSREAIAEVVEILEPDHFYKPAHGHLYDAIMSLYSGGEPVDAVTVAEELQRAGLLDEVGGPAVLLDFQATTPAISNAAHYAKIVEEHALLRRMIVVSNEIAESAYSIPEDVVKAVDEAEARMFDVAQRRVTNTTAAIRDLLPANLDRIEMLYDRGEAITGSSTGYLDLDEKLAGLQPSALYVIGARPAMGKALALDTPIATPSGWSTMEDLVVGDLVFDERGAPTSVTYKSPVFTDHECFDVVFDDGSVIVADAEHQWHTWGDQTPESEHATRTTAEIVLTLRVGADERPNHWIPVAEPLDCAEADLELDPYLLGGRLGQQHTHIPSEYLRASVKQRLALLQGLMDVDGYMVAGATTCRVALSTKQLTRDVRELVHSLGYRTSAVESRGTTVLSFSALDSVFRRSPNAEAQQIVTAPNSGQRWRSIVDVRPVDRVSTQCITVDSPSHLYLAGRAMIPTHNTAFALGMAANSAMKDNRPVLVFTLEMSQLELSQRLLCSEALVDAGRVKTGRLEEGEWNRISHAVGRLAEAPIYIDDNPHTSVMDIRAKARRLKSREGDLGMVVVDYIQLMTGRSGAESRQVEVSEISRNLKILARELDAPVVALAQLNRSLEQRTDKRPMLSDLRESGCMPASTRVTLADGSETTMGELLETGATPNVLAVDERGRIVSRRLRKTFPSGVKDVYRMTLASGRSVDATANHKFLTIDGWTPLGDLQPGGQYLAVPRQLPVSGSPVERPEAELVMAAPLTGDGSTVTAAKHLEFIDVATSDIYWDEVVSIEPLGDQPVFDVTVDEVHNFIANGIVAHNSLEQDADVVLFLYRDEVYDEGSPDKGVAEVIIAKHRNGPTGKARLAFRGQYTRFDNMAKSNPGGGPAEGGGPDPGSVDF